MKRMFIVVFLFVTAAFAQVDMPETKPDMPDTTLVSKDKKNVKKVKKHKSKKHKKVTEDSTH